jgi:hypothetical protein
MLMYHRVIAPISGDLMTALEPYRQKYDARVNQMPPHIGIVSPFDCDTAPELLHSHLKAVGETHAPIKVSLVGWDIQACPKGFELRLPLIAGRVQFSALRDHLLSDVLQPLATATDPNQYWPAIYFGTLSTAVEAQQIRLELKHFEPRFTFRVTYLELWSTPEITASWKFQKKIGLEATLASRGKRNKTPSSPVQPRP